jgi:flavin reductase (DIM6/NTAB) family NADH-FMN oxidoreductase RutF
VFAGLAGLEGEARFRHGTWQRLKTGAPALLGALVSFDCRLASITEVSTHSVLFCEVVAIRHGTGDAALIYYGRDYHTIASTASVLR